MIEYGNIQLRMLDGYEINKSSQTVSFSSIKVDFTGHTADDLPEKYQEVKVIINGKLKFIGYVNGYNFGELRTTDKYVELDIELLSPIALCTLRTVMLTGEYDLTDLITRIFEPLIDDGFEIQELNITNRKVNVNYVCETIEYAMNKLASKYNIWWYIDENKKIYVKDLTTIFDGTPIICDETHKVNGLISIKPTMSSYDYANVVNFTNVRLFELSRWYSDNSLQANKNPLINSQISSIKKEYELDFNYPVDISEKNLLRSANVSQPGEDVYYYALYIAGTYTDNSTFQVYIRYNLLTKTMEQTSNFDFDGNTDTTKEFLLKRDSFFANLITGFKYNGDKTIRSITSITSDSALIWNVNRFYNDKEILDKKGIISKTGIVEITVDMNEQWKTPPELMDLGASYIKNNGLVYDNTIELKLDKDVFKVGDVLNINKIIFNGIYVITEVKERYNKVSSYTVIAKNSKITNNYLDLFRKKETQENDDKVYQTFITHYQTDGIKEVHEVVK